MFLLVCSCHYEKKPTQRNNWVVQDLLVRDIDDLSGRPVSRATEPESTCFRKHMFHMIYRWPKFYVRRSVFCVLHSAFCVLHSAFGVLRSALSVLRSAFCIWRSAFCVQRSAFCIWRSAFSVRRSTNYPCRRKFQTFSSKSGCFTRGGRLQEVPNVAIWLGNFWWFGKLVAEERWSPPEVRLYYQTKNFHRPPSCHLDELFPWASSWCFKIVTRLSRTNDSELFYVEILTLCAEEKNITSGHRSTQPHFHVISGLNISPNRFWAPWERLHVYMNSDSWHLIARGAAMCKNIIARKHCFDGGFSRTHFPEPR